MTYRLHFNSFSLFLFLLVISDWIVFFLAVLFFRVGVYIRTVLLSREYSVSDKENYLKTWFRRTF